MERHELFRLVRLVEAKDLCTAAHTWRVTLYMQALAEAMGIDPPAVKRLMRGAVLHDLGKIDIPAAVLRKPGRLTGAEWELIKQHPTFGYNRLVALGEDDPFVLNLVLSHHENFDGSGYPNGVAGEDIPLEAQLFSVIDAFDAMTSFRPYRKENDQASEDEVLEELLTDSGTRYAPQVVEKFVSLARDRNLKWIRKHFNDRISMNALITPESLEELDALASHHGRPVKDD